MQPQRPREGAAPAATRTERYGLARARETWPAFLSFEHAALPAPRSFEKDSDELVVRRGVPPGRPISAGRVPDRAGAALFLQAASVLAALAAAGASASAEDFLESTWDVAQGSARLWLPGTPSGLSRGGAPPRVPDR